MAETPFGGDPVFGSPLSEGDSPVVVVPSDTFFILLETLTMDKLLLESGDAFLTEMAM